MGTVVGERIRRSDCADTTDMIHDRRWQLGKRGERRAPPALSPDSGWLLSARAFLPC